MRIIWLSAVAVVAGCGGGPDMTDAERDAVAQEVLAAHKSVFAAQTALDAERVNAFLADDMVAGARGRFTSGSEVQTAIQELYSRRPKLEVGYPHLEVEVLSPDIAVVYFTRRLRLTWAGGETREMESAETNVWVRTPEGWKIAHTHSSVPERVAPAPPAIAQPESSSRGGFAP